MKKSSIYIHLVGVLSIFAAGIANPTATSIHVAGLFVTISALPARIVIAATSEYCAESEGHTTNQYGSQNAFQDFHCNLLPK